MQIDELTRYTKLLDCYGKLLSQKQYEVMDKYLNLDISESEMAELDNGSRQSIHDAITKAKKQLLQMEEKCDFVKLKDEIANDLVRLKSNVDENLSNEIDKIITKL